LRATMVEEATMQAGEGGEYAEAAMRIGDSRQGLYTPRVAGPDDSPGCCVGSIVGAQRRLRENSSFTRINSGRLRPPQVRVDVSFRPLAGPFWKRTVAQGSHSTRRPKQRPGNPAHLTLWLPSTTRGNGPRLMWTHCAPADARSITYLRVLGHSLSPR